MRKLSLVFLLSIFAGQALAQFPGYNQGGNYGPNKLRNSTLSSWFHGSNFLSSQNFCGEGVYMVATIGGSSTNINRVVNTISSPYNSSVFACKILGNTSVTDVIVRWVVESYDSASWAGQQVTCQWPIQNNTGGTITPTLTVKTGASQDASWTNVDVSAVSLQSITDSTSGILQYTFAGSANMINGVSINIDFGNNFSTTGKSILIGGGFNCRSTPNFPTGQVPAIYFQPPDVPSAAQDNDWNQRYFVTTWDNNTLIGTATHNGMQGSNYFAATVYNGNSFSFPVRMRAAPVLTYYDGASGSSKVSTWQTGAWTDNLTATVTPVVVSTGFFFPMTALSGGGTHMYLHYTADATLLGN
jgi:hypothetical protein